MRKNSYDRIGCSDNDENYIRKNKNNKDWYYKKGETMK